MTHPVTLFLCYHTQDVLDMVPDFPFAQKVLLPSLKLDPPEWQDNRLAESRACLSEELVVRPGSEYAGLLNAKAGLKYELANFRWQNFPERLNALAPDVVLAPWGAAANWVGWSDLQHPGMGAVLSELAKGLGVSLANDRSSLWAQDFVCHRNVWDDWRAFFRRAFEWCYERWGLEPPTPVSNYDPRRRPAYLYERFTTMYFASRRDLRVLPL